MHSFLLWRSPRTQPFEINTMTGGSGKNRSIFSDCLSPLGVLPRTSTFECRIYHSPFMNYDWCQWQIGSVRGKKEFEPSSLAAESESLLGPHLEDY